MSEHAQLVEHFLRHPEAEAKYLPSDAGSTRQVAVPILWPLPGLLPSELPAVQPMLSAYLPEALRSAAADISERFQVPLDFPAIAQTCALAGCVGRRAAVQPKAADTSFVVVPNLWGGIVNPSGFMKSPVLASVLRQLEAIEGEWHGEYELALADHRDKQERHELALSAWKEQFKRASKAGKEPPARPELENLEPAMRRLIMNDATFESLHKIMAANPLGVLLARDEVAGWLAGLDRQGREGERQFALEAWSGDRPFVIDRIGRGQTRAEFCCLSIIGGIQPGRLRSYLVDALRDGPADDGLIQRFQLLVWPDPPAEWRLIDRPPDEKAAARARHVFHRLANWRPDRPALFKFSKKGQELFFEWLKDLEGKVRGGQLHQALVCHLSKFRSLMPSLALLFELADSPDVPGADPHEISLDHARQAAEWCEYLESHARRVYACAVNPAAQGARSMAGKIKTKSLPPTFSCREVYLKGWSGLDSPGRVKDAADVLVDSAWLREVPDEPSPLGGRPSLRWEVNPNVFRGGAK